MMPQLSNKLCLSIPYMYLKQIHVDSMLLWVCFVMYCRRHKNVVRTTVTHSTAPHIPFFFCFYTVLICDLLLNRDSNMESIC